MALNDLLEQHRELFPSSSTTTGRPRALVPGCGRGHDVLLLSAFGYDVTGFDVSENSLREAAANEQKHGGDEVYKVRKGVAEEKGTVKWVNGDFFDEGREELKGGWDLIYDYTVSCPSQCIRLCPRVYIAWIADASFSSSAPCQLRDGQNGRRGCRSCLSPMEGWFAWSGRSRSRSQLEAHRGVFPQRLISPTLATLVRTSNTTRTAQP